MTLSLTKSIIGLKLNKVTKTISLLPIPAIASSVENRSSKN